jgi:hypothetical protein
MTSSKEKVWRHGQMEHDMRENTRKGGKKDMEYCISLMVLNTQVFLPIMKSTVMEYMNGLMEGCIRGIGNKTK